MLLHDYKIWLIPFAALPGNPTGSEPESASKWIMSDATRILIVDDEPYIRQLIRTTLDNGQRNFLEAGSTVEGLICAREAPPDIALIDIGLPGCFDGFSLCEALAMERQLKHVRIVIVTGYDGPEDVDRARHLGIAGYVVKPFSPEMLRALISRLEAVAKEMEFYPSQSLARQFC